MTNDVAWKTIESWHAANAVYSLQALEVTISGPYVERSPSQCETLFYARLPGGYSAKGISRTEALIHAAEWCDRELQKGVDRPTTEA